MQCIWDFPFTMHTGFLFCIIKLSRHCYTPDNTGATFALSAPPYYPITKIPENTNIT